jgi:hypothetical protein
MFRGRHENRQEPAIHENRNGHVLPEIEDEFRELVRRRGIRSPGVRAESGNGNAAANDLTSLAQSISGPAVLEIDKLIAQLQDVGDHLVNEGQRVQRAITEYAQMSQAATKSTKLIAENLAQWRQTAESRQADGASVAVGQTEGKGSEPVAANHPRDPGAGPA